MTDVTVIGQRCAEARRGARGARFSLLHAESRLVVPVYTQPMRGRVACAPGPAARRLRGVVPVHPDHAASTRDSRRLWSITVTGAPLAYRIIIPVHVVYYRCGCSVYFTAPTDRYSAVYSIQ